MPTVLPVEDLLTMSCRFISFTCQCQKPRTLLPFWLPLRFLLLTRQMYVTELMFEPSCLTYPTQFFSSSICDLYSLLDDDLKYKLAYAWTLPVNARFIMKMKGIQDGVNDLLPATKCLESRIYYFIHRIRETVIVSTYISLSSTSLDLRTLPCPTFFWWSPLESRWICGVHVDSRYIYFW